MVTRYDVISSRWSSHFWVKMYHFQLFSGIKVKFVHKMMQSNYLWATLRVERKKISILTVLTRLAFSQDGGQDGDHVW